MQEPWQGVAEKADQACYIGAIAISTTYRTYGYSWGYADEDEAKDRARPEAGDPGAPVIAFTWYGFMALAQDAQGNYHPACHRTQTEANRLALQAAGKEGHLVVSFNTKYGPAD